jgi:molecular chaperone GrpE (heat shock protein)
MLNWIMSVVCAAVLAALGQVFGLPTEWNLIAGFVIWLLLGLAMSSAGDFARDVSEPEEDSRPVAETTTMAEPAEVSTQALHVAVAELSNQLRQKEKEAAHLHNQLSEREFRRSLSRLASISETLYFTLKLRTDGKLTDEQALEQLRMEIESAISDLGLEISSIIPGELPAGSFVVVKAEENPPAGKAGTVKEVISYGFYAKDENGKPHFISPSKITVYKL